MSKITPITLTSEQIAEKNKIINNSIRIMPDPNEELIHIYYISTTCELMGLRAENDHSPEHNVPKANRRLGIQNPNFTKIHELFTKIFKQQSYCSFCELVEFIN